MNSQRLTLDEIKECELQILKYFKAYCDTHKLRFFLCGGTLLGAVRHKGFIPWDDDIDVCMPREDYLKLLEIYNNDTENFILKSNVFHTLTAPFSKLVDPRTIVKRKYSESNNTNALWIDIFPVDGLPNEEELVRNIYKKSRIYRQIINWAECIPGEGKSFIKSILKYLLKPLANVYGKNRALEKIDNLARMYNYDTSEYVGIITNGLYGVGERMKKNEFEITHVVEFEGELYPTFSCWHTYLSGIYGDYMTLPPEEKRISHDMTVYMKD